MLRQRARSLTKQSRITKKKKRFDFIVSQTIGGGVAGGGVAWARREDEAGAGKRKKGAMGRKVFQYSQNNLSVQRS